MILGLHDAAVFLKQSFLSSPSCAEIISSFFMTNCCFSLHSSFSTSFLPISSGPSSIAGVSHPFSYFSGVSHVFCRKSELFCLQVLYSLYLWLRKEEVIFFFNIKRKGFFSHLEKSQDFHLCLQVCDNNHSCSLWEKEASDVYFYSSVQVSCPFCVFSFFFFFFILY